MTFAYPSVRSTATERSEQLARLIYELLDAHSDTERLTREHPTELQRRAHLNYLHALQRLGRQVLGQLESSSLRELREG
jgi:kynureninase